MQIEYSQVSLTGHRADNQDRVTVIQQGPSTLAVVVDGMGGHAEGAAAAEATIACISRHFREGGQPVLDPQGFLTRALADAHDQVVALGLSLMVEQRPRATCAVCLVQDGSFYSAHVGDSRIYQLRNNAIAYRTRDHSHVELLLSEGLIDEAEAAVHPMRNYVECCLGGDAPLPDMAVDARHRTAPGDVLLLCSDGLWTGLADVDLQRLTLPDTDLDTALASLAELAVSNNAPGSDNTSAAALRIGKGN